MPWRSDDQQVQVQCEGEALHQALLTFLELLQGKSVLHVTDCLPTLGLSNRGSAKSARLQRTGKDVWFL